jgi:hypothetical protein
MSVELLLPTIHGLAVDPQVTPTARTDVFRTLTRLAGLETKEAATPNLERFAITINLGSPDKSVTIDTKPVQDAA